MKIEKHFMQLVLGAMQLLLLLFGLGPMKAEAAPTNTAISAGACTPAP